MTLVGRIARSRASVAPAADGGHVQQVHGLLVILLRVQIDYGRIAALKAEDGLLTDLQRRQKPVEIQQGETRKRKPLAVDSA